MNGHVCFNIHWLPPENGDTHARTRRFIMLDPNTEVEDARKQQVEA